MFPNPWMLLGAGVVWIGTIVGAFFYGEHIDSLSYKTAIAGQERDASTLLAQLTATQAAKDAQAADFARNIDKVTADAKEKNAADAAAAQSGFDQQLRRIAGRRASCPSPGTTEAVDTGDGQGSAGERRDRLLSQVARDFAELGKSALDLAAYAKACHAFAIEVGR